MNSKHVILGLVLIVVFWAFQMGYMSSLATAEWFAGVIIFSVAMFLMGKTSGETPTDDHKMVWMFAMIFAIVLTAIISFVPPSALGLALPAGFTPAMWTPVVLSLWLVIYGGAMFAGGHDAEKGMMILIGLIWLFSAVHIALVTGPNSYLHFGMITGLSAVVGGLLKPAK